MSVRILSTVETSCTTNPQQIAVMELEGYSWPTTTSFVDNAIVLLWRNFLSPEFGTESQREVPSKFWRYPSFLMTQCGIDGRKPPCQKQLDSSSGFDTIPACDGRTVRHTMTEYTALAWRRAVKSKIELHDAGTVVAYTERNGVKRLRCTKWSRGFKNKQGEKSPDKTYYREV